ncbi:MAG: transglutaminase-like cysteine peptidase [Campylobacterota bacterium]|nr:transglutaminase-like cysteine peptidase [Campylobacterota bacterium]
MRYFLLLITTVLLHASAYPNFTYKEAISIEESSGKEAVNRIFEYNEIINSDKKETSLKQLKKINTYLNKLTYKSDKSNNNKRDHWATPKEFLISGNGDCEDYAILKYYTLIKLGFDPKKLFITIVYHPASKSHHMVLSYFIKDGEAPLILDNSNPKILNLTQRNDLKINAFLNTSGVYRFNKKSELTKTKESSKKLKSLLKRVQIES